MGQDALLLHPVCERCAKTSGCNHHVDSLSTPVGNDRHLSYVDGDHGSHEAIPDALGNQSALCSQETGRMQ